MSNPNQNSTSSHDASDHQQESHGSSRSLGRSIVLGVVGIGAALICIFAMRTMSSVKVFKLPPELAVLEGTLMGVPDQQRLEAGMVVLNYKNFALWFGINGAIIGGIFGLALGLFRRSSAALAIGLVGGLILGGAFSSVGGYLSNYFGENVIKPIRQENRPVPEQYTMLTYGITWLLVGLGVGLGTGLGATKTRLRSASASMAIAGIGAAAGGAFYPILASVAMPLVDTTHAIPKDDFGRIVWIALPCAMMGLVLGRKS